MKYKEGELSGYIIIALVVLALRVLRVTSPLHEVFHLIGFWSTGVNARITSWTSVMPESSTFFGYFSGYFFEITIFGYLAIAWRRVKKQWKGWACFGYFVGSVYVSINSVDYEIIMDKWPELTPHIIIYQVLSCAAILWIGGLYASESIRRSP